MTNEAIFLSSSTTSTRMAKISSEPYLNYKLFDVLFFLVPFSLWLEPVLEREVREETVPGIGWKRVSRYEITEHEGCREPGLLALVPEYEVYLASEALLPPVGVGVDAGIYEAVPGLRLNIVVRSEEHTSELQSQSNLVCPLLLSK